MNEKLQIKIGLEDTTGKNPEVKSWLDVKTDIKQKLDAIKAEVTQMQTVDEKISAIQNVLNNFFKSREDLSDTRDIKQRLWYTPDGGKTQRVINDHPLDNNSAADIAFLQTDMLQLANDILSTEEKLSADKIEITDHFGHKVAELKQEIAGGLPNFRGIYTDIIKNISVDENADVLQSRKQTVVGMKQSLVQRFRINTNTAPAPIGVGRVIAPYTEYEIRELYNKYDLLDKEVDARIQLNAAYAALNEAKDALKDVGENPENKKKNGNIDKKKVENMTETLEKQIRTTQKDIEKYIKEILGYRPNIDKKSLLQSGITLSPVNNENTLATKNETPPVTPNKVELKTSAGEVKPINTFGDLEKSNLGPTVTKQFRQNVNTTYTSGQFMNPAVLDPDQRKYCEAYHKLYLNHMSGAKKESEADFLTALTKIDTKFANEKIGDITDFKQWAKSIKDKYKNENKKAKILAEMIPCIAGMAQARAFTTRGMDYYDKTLQNLSGPAHDHNAPQARGCAPDVRHSAPYHLADTCEELLGPSRRSQISTHMPRGYFAKKYTCLSDFVPPHLLYPGISTGSVVHDGSNEVTNGVILRGQNGGYEIHGELSNDTLLALYMQRYNLIKTSVEEGISSDKIGSPALAFNVVRRRFKPGNNSLDVVSAVRQKLIANGIDATQAEIEAKQLAEKLLSDAIKYDDDVIVRIRQEFIHQADYYRAEEERRTGRPVTDRKIDYIPADKRHRMLSRAAVVGFAQNYGFSTASYPMIEERLRSVYLDEGGRDVTGEFIHNSSELIGQDIARLIDDHKNQEGYAIKDLTLSDIGTVDQLKTQGLFGMAGTATTALLKQIPGMTPEMAHKGGEVISLLLKVGAAWRTISTAWDYVSGGTTLGKKISRAGGLAVVAYFLGKDLISLGYGGKGGFVTRAMSGRRTNKDQYDDGKISAQEYLGFTFGNQSLNELSAVLEKKKNGHFGIKKESLQSIFNTPGLTPEQKETLQALYRGSTSGMDLMITEGLTWLGITPDNLEQKKLEMGNMKIKDIINRKAEQGAQERLLREALACDENDPTYQELKQLFPTNDPERMRVIIERMKALRTHQKNYLAVQTVFQHMLNARPSLFDVFPDAATLQSVVNTGFNQPGVSVLRKQFILGEAPFSALVTIDGYHTEAKKLFADHQFYTDYIQPDNGFAALDQLVNLTTAPGGSPDGLLTIDATQNKKWYVNRVSGTPAHDYPEALLQFPNKQRAIVGIENTTSSIDTDPGNTKQYLVLRVPNTKGIREKWTVTNMNTKEFFVSGFGRGTSGGNEIFSTRIYSPSQKAYGDAAEFSAPVLEQLADHASRGVSDIQLDSHAMSAGIKPAKLQIRRDISGDRPHPIQSVL